MQLKRTAQWLAAILLGCGGVVADSGDGSAPPNDAAYDVVNVDAGPVDEAGYTACRSPSGYEICGGGCLPPVCLNGCDAGS